MRKGNEGARSDWETGLQRCGKLKIELGPGFSATSRGLNLVLQAARKPLEV